MADSVNDLKNLPLQRAFTFVLLTFLCSCRCEAEEHFLLHTEQMSFFLGSPKTETKGRHNFREDREGARGRVSASPLLPSSPPHWRPGVLAPLRRNTGTVYNVYLSMQRDATPHKHKTSQVASTEPEQRRGMGSGEGREPLLSVSRWVTWRFSPPYQHP